MSSSVRDGETAASPNAKSFSSSESSQVLGQLDEPKLFVSITVPTYNNADTIAQCVESLASQQYRPVEVIVVDDGSTDGTGDV